MSNPARLQKAQPLPGKLNRACSVLQAAGAADDALSWQELKLAAEAGFEELLRVQEAAAAASGQNVSPAWRRPGMTRTTGGGGSTAGAWTGTAWPDLPAASGAHCAPK